ncbi:MAG: hypothetical protein JXR37_16630, partial [Kiritimatiellae bacterium]|nr:hypothetical protein [Kiritimatiellia bacterium]
MIRLNRVVRFALFDSFDPRPHGQSRAGSIRNPDGSPGRKYKIGSSAESVGETREHVARHMAILEGNREHGG